MSSTAFVVVKTRTLSGSSGEAVFPNAVLFQKDKGIQHDLKMNMSVIT